MRYIISFLLSILPLTAVAEVPRVITDIPPIYGLTQMVMGDLGTPVLLLAKGADEHDFQLRPSQMRDIALADLAVWVGPKLTPWLDRALAGGDMVSLALMDQAGTHVMAYGAAHDHGAETGQSDHEGANPHLWMDPENAVVWLDRIAEALANLDSEHAAMYRANATAAKASITQMDADIATQLASLRGKAFVTYHDAYGYFIDHYGLNFAGSVALGDASSAGAAHIEQLQSKIAGGVVCVFPEAQHDSDLLLQLLTGTSARAGGALDPVGSTLDAAADTYVVLMRGLAETLADCLSGA
jgi:zinc transport system substrate-binding protein